MIGITYNGTIAKKGARCQVAGEQAAVGGTTQLPDMLLQGSAAHPLPALLQAVLRKLPNCQLASTGGVSQLPSLPQRAASAMRSLCG
jgi:hypothetical protein